MDRAPQPTASLLLHRSATASLALAALLAAGTVHAQRPLDLSDRTPRRVAVRFEVSESEHPAALDRRYSAALPARLEAGDDGGVVEIVIEGAVVERHLLRDKRPKPRSFGDFVWRFDAATGEVIEASLEGVLLERIDWGLGSTSTEAHIRVVMSTLDSAGFLPPLELFGHRIFRFCASESLGCELVEPVPLVRDTGYVNAVGSIAVESPIGLSTRSFSPLGEALFLEAGSARAAAAEPAALPDVAAGID